ncbi:iron-sulfur cluster assembly accessory protein [Kineobactrum sediminis]|uniref:Iron-sulfur cluster assembly accessory protein n=1 Tax=Kineobactrum sediminis TaxID=1905677 RepID=A0A2N5Y1S1_9GAMM|nr:iron-sulfur cluster assembly accessory protein [Kineobactrum sediminis]PLW82340.1 iron-sulfur cluster assembly accessory protein [Kineobactrum sediminis]
MSVETFDVTTDAVVISPAAASHLKKQLEQSGKRAVRISVRESGCTGFMYVMDEVDQSATGDLEVHLENGLDVFIDPSSLPVLNGTRVDYEREGVNRTIKFHNPNVTAACGCGESFSIS